MKKPKSHDKRTDVILIVLLMLVVLVVYWQALGYDFVNYDDDDYVTANPFVRQGLTLKSLGWAFTTLRESNWHPLTWISHTLDVQVFGMNPAGHHLTNILLHLANTLLLFLVLRIMTGSLYGSAFVAALFGIHPLHVESVAWISERKDVLSTFFGLLAMLAYARYAENPGLGRYSLVLLAFVLSLMSKPMLVTLPFVLLLLDYWPLGRVGKVANRKLVLEKAPLLAIAAGSCVITFIAQQRGLSVASLNEFPFGVRVANALTAYAGYLGKTVFPSGLAILYPHPGDSLPVWKVAGSAILLASTSLAAVRIGRYAAVGWLWFLGTLIPVIGFVQVGWQSMADRYTYFPLIGMFILIAWGAPEIVRGRGKLALPAVVTIVGLMICARMQTGYWQNSLTLFQRALDVTQNNAVAHNNLGAALVADGRIEEAIEHHRTAVEIQPGWADGHYSLGAALLAGGSVEEAVVHLEHAIEITPHHAKAHNNLGAALVRQGKIEKAIERFADSIRLDPHHAPARNNLGTALLEVGEPERALQELMQAVRIDPGMADAHYNLGLVLARIQRNDEAISAFRKTVELQPEFPEALNNLAWLLIQRGSPEDRAEAVELAREACRLTDYRNPDMVHTLEKAREE